MDLNVLLAHLINLPENKSEQNEKDFRLVKMAGI